MGTVADHSSISSLFMSAEEPMHTGGEGNFLASADCFVDGKRSLDPEAG